MLLESLSKKANANKIKVVISTGDKDLAQLVNSETTLVNTMNNEKLDVDGVKNKFGVPPSLIIDYLTIIGDTADNVPGIEKVGPKTAVKWLTEHNSLDKIVKNSDTFKGVVGENLRKAIDWLPTAKDLITIRCDLDIQFSWDEFIKKDSDNDQLIYEDEMSTEELNDIDKEDSNVDGIVKNEIDNIESSNKASNFNNKNLYITINDEQTLNQWIQKIKLKRFVVIDTETDSLNVMIANLVGISISIESGSAAYIPLQHQSSDNFIQLDLDLVIVVAYFRRPKDY